MHFIKRAGACGGGRKGKTERGRHAAAAHNRNVWAEAQNGGGVAECAHFEFGRQVGAGALSKETWIHGEKETYIYEKRPTCMNRDLHILHIWIWIPSWNRCSLKRDLNLWAKRPTHMKRDLNVWKGTYIYRKFESETALQNARKLSLVAELEQVLPQKRPESMGKETYAYAKRPAYVWNTRI